MKISNTGSNAMTLVAAREMKSLRIACLLACATSGLFAQTNATAPNSAQQPGQAVSNTLSNGQKNVAERFERLEELLLRSSELEAGENPSRAALLQQAAQLGKQMQVATLLAKAAGNLEKDQLTEAIEQQKIASNALERLLELLQSENREKRVREQRDQVRRWIEETDRLLRLQGSLRGRTEGGQDAKQAASDQSKLAEKAHEIAQDLSGESEQNPGEDPKQSPTDPNSDSPPQDGSKQGKADGPTPKADPAETQKADGAQNADTPPSPDATPSPPDDPDKSQSDKSQSDNSADQEPSSPKDSPAQKAEGSKQPNQGQPNQGQPSQGQPSQGEPSQGEPSQGEPSQGQPSQGEQSQGKQENKTQPPEPQNPTERALQQIEQAQQKMKEAQQALENAQREGAIEKQREAEANLREAIEQLEEILRQLREEEVERSLASLETRLRRMLEMQNKVLEETRRLQEIAGDDNGARQVEIRANNLSLEERKILSEGERAYLLLRDEGSSAAFPEAVEQLNTDIANVVERLGSGDVGSLTLVIEEEIVSSLEEMVEALVKVQKENKEKQQQQQGQPQSGQPGDQPLVDKLAEIRLIRTLQLRINKRTDALSKLLSDPTDAVGQGKDAEILGELRGLSTRESSLRDVTRNIAEGKGE